MQFDPDFYVQLKELIIKAKFLFFKTAILLLNLFVVECQRWLHHIFSVLAMRLTEAIIVYGREDKRRNLKIVRSKEFRPNFPVAEQNVGRIWPQPKCSKVGKVHQPPAGRSGVRGLRCVLHCATLCYTASTPYYTMLNYATQGCKGVQQHFTSASPGSEVAETGE